MLSEWTKKLEKLAEQYEALLTCILILLAILLLGIALFGKPHHKAACLAYIIL